MKEIFLRASTVEIQTLHTQVMIQVVQIDVFQNFGLYEAMSNPSMINQELTLIRLINRWIIQKILKKKSDL
jgi:hypothetical protein